MKFDSIYRDGRRCFTEAYWISSIKAIITNLLNLKEMNGNWAFYTNRKSNHTLVTLGKKDDHEFKEYEWATEPIDIDLRNLEWKYVEEDPREPEESQLPFVLTSTLVDEHLTTKKNYQLRQEIILSKSYGKTHKQ